MFSIRKDYQPYQKRVTIIICCLVLTIIAAMTSFVYRGIYPDDLPRYSAWAETILSHKGLGSVSPDSTASVLYHALIALAYILVGKDLFAAHLFPYLFAVITPISMFLLLHQIIRNPLWAFMGTIAYLVFPTNIIWTNQPLTEPIFLFWLMLTMLCIELAKIRYAFLVLVGIAAAFMMLTRLFDGFLYASLACMAIIIQHRKQFPIKMVIGAFAGFVGIHLLASFLFDYSLLQYYYYYRIMPQHLVSVYPYENTPFMQTMIAIKSFIRWYSYSIFVPIFLGVLVAGFMDTLRKNIVFPALCLTAYAGFILFLYQARHIETFNLRLGVKMIPSLIVLFVCGVKWLYDSLLASQKRHFIMMAYIFVVSIIAIFTMTAVQKNIQFITFMTDIIPSSSLWEIIQHRPVYAQAQPQAALLAQEPAFAEKAFREEVIKVIKGSYRPSYRLKLAQHAWSNNEPRQAREHADFAYHDTFEDGRTWKTDAIEVTGTSLLWTDKHQGHLGAFPYQADGTVVYRFSFPRKAGKIVLSDIHTQWSPDDIVRMWTSFDGQQWTLRHDDNFYRQKMYYHEVMTEEIEGTQTLYVKYYFYAGDAERSASDNRGASLDEFSLAVTFQAE